MIYLLLIYRYLCYYFRAETKYNIHSPFLSEFIQHVLEDRRRFYAFEIIQSFRKYLMQDKRKLDIIELGAGSKVNRSSKRSIRSLAKYASIDSHSGRILFRISQLYKPNHILELGTSLGISSLYLAYGHLRGSLITIEGNPAVAKEAEAHFRRMEMSNIELRVGHFDNVINGVLEDLKTIDLVFIDGNHTEEATLRYFESMLPYIHEHSILVFGDIHWSKGMEKAWKQIIAHPKVRISLDLFHLGIVFFRKENREKEDYTLIRSGLKPWKLGFF